ncbi:MAG: ABC transporter permease [Burkholderiales bacterium]|jgi:lipopolysaccharide transport system permease protein|nr:ABC transporter permease [Burkholderiales bacterium]
MVAPSSGTTPNSADQLAPLVLGGGVSRRYWRDVWKGRELMYFFAWRDLLVRYKQTFLGIAWAVLRPVLTILVFSIVFGRIAGLPSDGVPYVLLVGAGMLAWQFFSTALIGASDSVVANANMVTKVYFPRLVLPVAAIVVSLVDFLVSALILTCLMLWYGIAPGLRILAAPVFLLLGIVAAAGFGFWVSALNVKYRDFRYVVPFVLQLGLYVSPVGFSSAVVPDQWRFLYSLNPLVAVIDGFRWSLLGTGAELYWPGLLLSSFFAIMVLYTGLMFFRATERSFADVI